MAMKKTTQLKPLGSSSDKAAIARAKAKKASTSYSPKPMSAFAKEKAAMRGAATAAKVKNPMGLKQMNFDKKAKKK